MLESPSAWLVERSSMLVALTEIALLREHSPMAIAAYGYAGHSVIAAIHPPHVVPCGLCLGHEVTLRDKVTAEP